MACQKLQIATRPALFFEVDLELDIGVKMHLMTTQASSRWRTADRSILME